MTSKIPKHIESAFFKAAKADADDLGSEEWFKSSAHVASQLPIVIGFNCSDSEESKIFKEECSGRYFMCVGKI